MLAHYKLSLVKEVTKNYISHIPFATVTKWVSSVAVLPQDWVQNWVKSEPRQGGTGYLFYLAQDVAGAGRPEAENSGNDFLSLDL